MYLSSLLYPKMCSFISQGKSMVTSLPIMQWSGIDIYDLFRYNTLINILWDIQCYNNKYSPFSKDVLIIELLGHKTAQTGHPGLMMAADRLGLVLTRTRTHGSTMLFQLIFGMTQNTSEYLTSCMHVFINVLQRQEDSKIKWPTPKKIVEYQEAVYHCHPFLPDFWCTMDGVKLMVECSRGDDEQNWFFTEWTCDHCIGAVLFFVQMVPFPSVATMCQVLYIIVSLSQLE